MGKRVLVLGGTGLVGSAVAFVLKRTGWDFAITSQSLNGPDPAIKHFPLIVDRNCNRTRKDLERILNKFHPTVVINALYAKDPDEAFATNITVPQIIANEHKRHLINISTDAVFPCGWKDYRPLDMPRPATMYGLLKWASERVAPQTTIRTSVIGVPFWTSPQKSLKKLYPAKRWTGRLWKGSTNLYLAEFILQLLEANHLTNRILHFAPSEALPIRNAFGLLFSTFGTSTPKVSTGTSMGMILRGCESHERPLAQQLHELKLAHL